MRVTAAGKRTGKEISLFRVELAKMVSSSDYELAAIDRNCSPLRDYIGEDAPQLHSLG